MLLAIDAGNTNIKFVIFDGDRQIAEWRAATSTHRTADEYAIWLIQLMALKGLQPSDVEATVIATVVPQLLLNLRFLCERYFNCKPLVVGEPECELGIKVHYTRPQDVGADRLADAIAAHAQWPGSLIVIDFGTATTFNVVAANGDYLGGVIAPGVNLNLQALHMAAAKLPQISVDRPDKVIGTDTVTAMKSGVYWGYISLIDGMVRKIEAEYGQSMVVVATGGLAALFAGGTKTITHVAPDLTTRGLLEIYRRNKT